MSSANVAKGTNVNILKVNKLSKDAHWKWMREGWVAFKLSWRPSIKIGASVVLISLLIVGGLILSGFGAVVPAAYGGFAIVGPVIATLIYAIGRQVEEDGKIKQLRKVELRPHSPSQLGFIGFTLLFIFMIWAILAHLIWALSVGLGTNMNESDFIRFALTTPKGLIMLVVGTMVGSSLALIGFSLAAISIPLVFDRDIDALTAMATSASAIIQNPMTMLSWGFVISVAVALSAPFLFLPMIVIFPWLGHATWKAYRDIVG